MAKRNYETRTLKLWTDLSSVVHMTLTCAGFPFTLDLMDDKPVETLRWLKQHVAEENWLAPSVNSLRRTCLWSAMLCYFVESAHH